MKLQIYVFALEFILNIIYNNLSTIGLLALISKKLEFLVEPCRVFLPPEACMSLRMENYMEPNVC
jgi:hypothetical protein